MDQNNNSGISISKEDDLLEEFDISSISEIGVEEIAEKFIKLKAELLKTKEANSNQFAMQMGIQIGEKIGDLKKDMAAMGKQIGEFQAENIGLKTQIDAISKAFNLLNLEIIKMKKEFSKKNSELEGKIVMKDREMKAEMQRMKEQRKSDEEMMLKENKLDVEDCGPDLAIFQKGMAVKHAGPSVWNYLQAWNSVRAILPVPKIDLDAKKKSIAFYFEVEIITMRDAWFGDVGFCDEQFPLDGDHKFVGNVANSIGISTKEGMRIDGDWNDFKNGAGHFHSGDVVGVGLFYSPSNSSLKCFATVNGKLLGAPKLPAKFTKLRLFPAVTLNGKGSSIRVHFAKAEWLFDPSKLLQ